MNPTAPHTVNPVDPIQRTAHRSKRLLWLFLGIIIVLALAVAGWWLYQTSQPHRQPAANSQAPSNNSTSNAADVLTVSNTSSNDGKGAWLRLDQAWKVPRPQHAMVNYLQTSDGQRVFLTASAFGGNDSSSVRAYDGTTGKKLWEVPFDKGVHGAPLAGEGLVIQATTGGDFVALETNTGHERWRVHVEKPFIDNLEVPGTFLDGIFYYIDGSAINGVDVNSGQQRYHSVSKYLSLQNPRTAGDHLIVMSDFGTLFGMSKDLKQLWGYTFPQDNTPNDLTVLGGIALTHRILDDNNKSIWTAFDINTGTQLWTTTTQRANQPVLVDGVIAVMGYETSQHVVIGLDHKTGQQLWIQQAKDGFEREKITVADGTLLSIGHHLQILDPKTGKVTFDRAFTFGSTTVPVAAGGHIVATFSDAMYGLR